jgi:hypothetical protein
VSLFFLFRLFRYFAPPAVAGDPHFTGFAGQTYEVHGQAGAIYNLLTFPRTNVNALFKRIDSTEGRRPHQLRPARAFGVSAYKAQQAIANAAGGRFTGVASSALDHFHLSVKTTTAWAHPGNYLGAIGMLVNDNRLLVEGGSWEKGFKRVELNGQPLRIGTVAPLLDRINVDGDSDDDMMVDAELSATADALWQQSGGHDGAADSGTDRGQEISAADSEAESAAELAALLPPEHTVFRFNTHQLAIHLPYISLVLTNSDGFVNLEQIALHDDATRVHEQIEGLLGQSHAVHHMAANGTKNDNDLHLHRQLQREQDDGAQAADPERAARLSRMRLLSRAYKRHAQDARYHIDDYYVDSQDIFGTDFVENRYSQ